MTCLVLLLYGEFYYTPRAVLGVTNFSSTSHAISFVSMGCFSTQPELCHVPTVALTRPVLFCVESFSYTTRARAEFLLHAVGLGTFSYSYTPVLFYERSFFYTPRALLCEDFLAPFSLNVGCFF